ncbi:ribonuclease I [Thiorhodococcus mannitoliphagus]|uniref:Ribonuclease I n=1 Tax=Thiorhodococcus mannitoliphagus TaxID=329406 RepID=A0A6P1E054_9GAMM|nr:ribonuclease I [Thiorhodococcus mannitoliphagus]NEX21374.1 ribonuclease I [Thiorhodococcus mannitoliphagus]
MKHLSLFTAALYVAFCAVPAQAQQVNLDGYFIALSACEATKKKDGDNPGNVRLQVRHAYDVIARNATPGTHYQIQVPGAPVTEARWVSMSCGALAPGASLVSSPGSLPEDGGAPPATSGALAPESLEYLLAASWQPGFCATAAGQGKPECRSQTSDRYDATHFSLHGLWPDDLDDAAIFPCYCDRGSPIECSFSQARDTSLELSPVVMERLRVRMPGVQSGLHLHEWPKHGACYEDDKTGPDAGATPDEYFTESMALLDALNASPIRDLFVAHLDGILTRTEIEDSFNDAFGHGAGERIQMRCAKITGENVITELWISLKGDIGDPADLASLIQSAPRNSVSASSQSCFSGRVVKVPR